MVDACSLDHVPISLCYGALYGQDMQSSFVFHFTWLYFHLGPLFSYKRNYIGVTGERNHEQIP